MAAQVVSGSCFCKKITVELSGEPHAVALCHCTDCRKLTGCPFTLNFIAPATCLKITSGTPTPNRKTADSGKVYKNYFCTSCGSPIYGGAVDENDKMDSVVIRAGVFNDLEMLGQKKPSVEIYTAQRLQWIRPVEGCVQFEGMLPSS